MTSERSKGADVLVVDDNPDVLQSVLDELVDAGYRAVGAHSGAEALAILAAGARPGLVLVDLMMPEMNGWDLILAIRERGLADVAIVSMTAGDRLMEAPVSSAYLQKPILREELMRVVTRFCGSRP